MRTSSTALTAHADDDDLLTTGEAALLIGVSRQHVVDLTMRGDLPYETVGTHRRIRRADLERLRFSTSRMSADQRRALRLGYATAGRLAEDPERALAIARDNLANLRRRHTRGRPAIWLQQWQVLLDGPVDDLLEVLTSPTPRARDLRQNSPFAGVLSDEQRAAVLDAAR